MKILNLNVDTPGMIALTIDNVVEYLPHLFKRITPDNYSYFDTRILLQKTDENTYVFDASRLLPYLHDSDFIRCDFIGFREANEATERITVFEEFDKITSDASFPLGNLHFQLYKNSQHGLSLYANFIPTVHFSLSSVLSDETHLTLSVTSDSTFDYHVFLMRRSNLARDFSYNAEIPLKPNKQSGKTKTIELHKYSLLQGCCQTAKEIWDVVVKVENMLLPVEATKECVTEYFPTDDDFQTKLFISDGAFAAFYTKYRSKINRRQVKVAIMGSCYTKEAFHSTHTNIDYKLYFTSDQLSFHQSIISVMSPPIPYDPAELTGHCKRELELYGHQVFGKTFIDTLRKDPPHYLLVDNYVEIAALLFETMDHSFVSESYYLADTPLLKKMQTFHKYGISNEKRFDLYRKAVDAFAETIKTILPEDHVILVRSKPALKGIKNGVLTDFPGPQWLKYVGKLWERNDNYFIQALPHARVIDMHNHQFVGVQLEGLTFSSNHLQHEYYRTIMNEMCKIALLDILRGDLK